MSAIPSGAAAIAEAVRAGRCSAGEILEESLRSITLNNNKLNAFLHVDSEGARGQAAALDAREKNEALGPLAGVPVAVKDNIATAGVPTTAASRMLETYRPPYDATVVERLRDAGAVLVGKTNLDEFSMGSSTENSAFGPTRNPWHPERVPGGSSGGSAAAVAAGLVPLALGSDTGGSIRQPASFCGVYGLLPTYGRVSRYGLIAFASSLDQIGGFSRDLDGLGLLYAAIAGHDPRDSTSASRPVEPVDPERPMTGRVGLAASLLNWPGVEPRVAAAVREAADTLAAGGATVVDIELPEPSTGIAAYYVLATAEASSNLARYDGVRYGFRIAAEGLETMYRATRSAGFGAEVQRRILLGTYALSAGYHDAYYGRAQRVRRWIRGRMERVFDSVDLVLLPTAPTTAFRLGEKTADPLAMYLADAFTVTANLAGIPALNVPAGRDAEGLPVGVQLLAPAWREDRLLSAAGVLDRGRTGPLAWPGGAR